MNQPQIVAHLRNRTWLPAWFTVPSGSVYAASFGIRAAAQIQGEFQVVFGTLTLDGIQILSLLAVGMLPVPAFRELKIVPPPRRQRVRMVSLVLLVSTTVGGLSFAWEYWGPLNPSAAAVTAYAVTLPATVTAAIILRRRSLR